jgi:hypothetical protein
MVITAELQAGLMMELILPMLKNIQQMILVCMIWLGM